MIDKFRAKFVEESLDNVHDLEEALLLLENDRSDKEIIERIFRAMHSLKGGGAMFGFNDLSEFTHHLETVYDWVRNGKLAVSEEIISVTFNAIDQIKYLLDVGDLSDNSDKQELAALTRKVQGLVSDSAVEKPVEESKDNNISEEKPSDHSKTYLINFKPHANILQNGTNVMFLLDDLHALGKAVVLFNDEKVPELSKLEAQECYVSWDIVLNTSEALNEIQDVFIFVEDECDLVITEVFDGDIIDHVLFEEIISKCQRKEEKLSAALLKGISWGGEEKKVSAEKAKKPQLKEHKISSIRVASNKIDELVNLVSELVTIQAQLNLYAEKKSGDPQIIMLSENIQKLTRQLRDNAFEISLIPIQNDLMRFQRLVRDLSKELNKEIDFIIEGGDIELDKNIIEHLTDPLLHMIRNCVDHAIEMPDERIKKGKNPKGNIIFRAYYEGANVIIKIIDDGKGIDPNFILNKAINKGLVEEGVELSKKEILDLVFKSGFSTKEQVSDLSGRGVGMDVVKRKIGEIRGEVSIDSEVDKGTTVTLELPLTLSIIDGLLVTVAQSQYVIPISAIEKIYPLEKEDKKNIFNDVITLGGEQFPVIGLRSVFKEAITDEKEHIIQVKYEDRQIGLIVDEVIGEYQTVVKPFGRLLKDQEVISGASIMGDGSVAMVIDTNRLVQFHSNQKLHK
ncbi:chemotaxis protein CheA [Saccharicrinis fermentans]|uniref:Chemotaxis protein CheA n=1 Tax=Saccharicrinis fermentans DSM 9555 = JCM 21142 TaxID=869213 RepID=W7YGT5_9BACT|nr:chemotaxis protein CheA [Saccharicrinis fermentans]GAF01829.1 chemotaxis protein CheA [Saccharicrinis fermentans DSM 9555 = JCM 21142]